MTRLTKHFTLEEAITLRRWNCLAEDMNETIMRNIQFTAEKMEVVRRFLENKPITVTSWYRPLKYNEEVSKAAQSPHLYGLAVDFQVQGMTCDRAREILFPHLRGLEMRMELAPGSDWVHLDCFPLCLSRAFTVRR